MTIIKGTKRTSNHDSGTLLGFVGWVGAHTVVSPLVLLSDTDDPVGSFQCIGGLGLERALSLSVVPGEADGESASLNRADESDALPLRDVIRAGLQGQHWY